VKGRREDDEVADKRGHTARGSERARERERLTGGAALPVRGRESAGRAGARAEAGRRWAERGGARARGRGGRGFGPGVGPTGGRGGFFSFSFYFLIPISLFASFSFEQFIL
jgi:hypothetical protein